MLVFEGCHWNNIHRLLFYGTQEEIKQQLPFPLQKENEDEYNIAVNTAQAGQSCYKIGNCITDIQKDNCTKLQRKFLVRCFEQVKLALDKADVPSVICGHHIHIVPSVTGQHHEGYHSDKDHP